MSTWESADVGPGDEEVNEEEELSEEMEEKEEEDDDDEEEEEDDNGEGVQEICSTAELDEDQRVVARSSDDKIPATNRN